MKSYLKHHWNTYWTKKPWFSKISDLIFILLVVGMIIPSSRKEISAFMAGILASSPKLLHESQRQSISETAWQWSFQTIDGESVSLNNFKGKVIFLNFWATWCPPCIAEIPDIQKLYDQFGKEAVFLLVSDESDEKLKKFMQRKDLHIPVYINRSTVPDVFASNSIPTTLIIDPSGNIILRKTGAAKWNGKSMQKIMKQFISE